jgi:hypothetical protein
MSERHGDRPSCQRGRTRRLRRRWRLRHLIEALRARIRPPIDFVNTTGDAACAAGGSHACGSCALGKRPRDRAFPEDRPWRTSARANREVHDGPMRSQHVARELFDR